MKKTYVISVKLLSALHINGGTNADGTRITMKESRNGTEYPYIPASLFKGLLREHFARIWRDCIGKDTECSGRLNADEPCGCMVCKLFGSAGFQQSRIYLDRLQTTKTPHYATRANVSINRYCRYKQDQALVFSEVADRFDSNADSPDFTGEMTVHYPPQMSDAQRQCVEAVLIEAVQQINCIGMGKSRGLGFVETQITEKEADAT